MGQILCIIKEEKRMKISICDDQMAEIVTHPLCSNAEHPVTRNVLITVMIRSGRILAVLLCLCMLWDMELLVKQ